MSALVHIIFLVYIFPVSLWLFLTFSCVLGRIHFQNVRNDRVDLDVADESSEEHLLNHVTLERA